MSPERIAPGRFGFKDSRPTVSSDCYALGMVIYETISGNFPFHKDTDLAVFMKVVEGERPPRGAKFPKNLWEMLERCWVPEPDSRPTIEDVLHCLGMAPDLLEPPSPGVGGGIDGDGDDRDSVTSSFGGDSLEFFATDNHAQLLSTEVRGEAGTLAEVEKAKDEGGTLAEVEKMGDEMDRAAGRARSIVTRFWGQRSVDITHEEGRGASLEEDPARGQEVDHIDRGYPYREGPTTVEVKDDEYHGLSTRSRDSPPPRTATAITPSSTQGGGRAPGVTEPLEERMLNPVTVTAPLRMPTPEPSPPKPSQPVPAPVLAPTPKPAIPPHPVSVAIVGARPTYEQGHSLLDVGIPFRHRDSIVCLPSPHGFSPQLAYPTALPPRPQLLFPVSPTPSPRVGRDSDLHKRKRAMSMEERPSVRVAKRSTCHHSNNARPHSPPTSPMS